MKVKVMLDKGAFMPKKAHTVDAGFDIFAPLTFSVKAEKSVAVDTGVHIAIPDGYVGFIKSKSGLNVKHGLVTEGVIDSGYTGSIVVKLYNNSDETYTFKCGDKITQIVILPIPQVQLEEVQELDATERGDGGFGSTGR